MRSAVTARQAGSGERATGHGFACWRLHVLKGSLKGHWAVWVDQNWRMTFRFEREDAVLVDYQDYH